MDDMREIMEDFLVEAFELVEQIDHDLIELESNPEDLELLNRIFRVAHTVKGSSSFLNFDILTKLTHHMEDVLNKARRNELKITPDIMDVVLESVDMMKGLLHGIRDSGNDTDVGIEIFKRRRGRSRDRKTTKSKKGRGSSKTCSKSSRRRSAKTCRTGCAASCRSLKFCADSKARSSKACQQKRGQKGPGPVQRS